MKIISVIGFSGSGKTYLILNALKLLRSTLNYKVAVIKNIHEHQIDKKDKDSYKFGEAGAYFSITQNINDETTIFLKKKISSEKLIEWLLKGPFNVDLIFFEGFRKLNYPTILCLKNWEELESQLNYNVKMISGLICLEEERKENELKIPIIDIENDFDKFLATFKIN